MFQVYSGVNLESFIQPLTLARQDIVITSYETLRRELNYVDLPHSNSEWTVHLTCHLSLHLTYVHYPWTEVVTTALQSPLSWTFYPRLLPHVSSLSGVPLEVSSSCVFGQPLPFSLGHVVQGCHWSGKSQGNSRSGKSQGILCWVR